MTYKITAECPECGHVVGEAAGIGKSEGVQPEPGDLAVCIRCAGLGIYVLKEDGTLGLRLTTVDEKVELSEDEDLTTARAAIIGLSVWMQP